MTHRCISRIDLNLLPEYLPGTIAEPR